MTAPAAPTFTEIKADQVSCTADKVTMLPKTTFTIHPGENVAITGENGCGKTTFLRVLTGNLIPTEGIVTRDGHQLDERDAATRRVIAPLIGPIAGFRDMTLGDHLIMVDQTWGGDRDGAGNRISAVLNKFDILRFGNRYMSQLSSGQRQLAELAMVLLRPSALLVLDEPEQRLDPGRRGLLAEVLQERVAEGGAVVWVCHDEALAEGSATRIEHFPQGTARRRPARSPASGKTRSGSGTSDSSTSGDSADGSTPSAEQKTANAGSGSRSGSSKGSGSAKRNTRNRSGKGRRGGR